MSEVSCFKWETIDLAISQVLKGFKAVPDFQREYVWERGHVQKLPEDHRLIKGPEYFRGTQLNKAIAALVQFESRKPQTVAERQEMLTALARKARDMPTASREAEA